MGLVFYLICVGILRGRYHWRWDRSLVMAGPIGMGAMVLVLFVSGLLDI